MSLRDRLAQRRKELVVYSNVLRTGLLADALLMRHTMTPQRIGSEMMQAVRQHQWLIAGAALATFVFKPSRILNVLKSGFLALRAVRSVTPLLQVFRKRP